MKPLQLLAPARSGESTKPHVLAREMDCMIATEKADAVVSGFRFIINPADGKQSNPFPGWPVTIRHAGSRAGNVIGWRFLIRSSNIPDPISP
jgi:hypothetical protein